MNVSMYADDLSSACDIAETLANNFWLHVALFVQLALCGIILLLTPLILLKGIVHRSAIHKNLKTIFFNIFAFNCIVCCPYGVWNLWYHYKFWRHSGENPCELMMPIWVTLVVRGPCLLYIAGYPLWHFAMTVERAWATLRVDEYEKISSSYGVFSACIVWLLSIAYAAYWGCTYLAHASEFLTDGTIFIVMTVPNNAAFMLNSHYALLVVDLLTSVVDIALLYSNVRRLRRITPNYTLSGSYQANENVLVTTRLMLPLDVSNSILYLTFLVLSAYFRAVALAYPLAHIITIFEWFWLANFLQMAVGLVIMVLFGRRPKKVPTVIAQEDHSSVYFQRLREQLGHEAAPLRDSC